MEVITKNEKVTIRDGERENILLVGDEQSVRDALGSYQPPPPGGYFSFGKIGFVPLKEPMFGYIPSKDSVLDIYH